MRYMDSLKFVASRPGWFLNLLLCGVCGFIPAIGQIVLLGYMFEVFDSLRRDPERKSYPDFTFNRFMPYLMRGIWPFLAQLLIGLIVTVPLMIIMFVVMMLGGALAGETKGGSIILVQIVVMLISLVFGLLVGVITWPAVIFEGLRQEFDVRGMIAFTKDFITRTWKETVLSMLLLMGVGVVLAPFGYLTCCLGFLVIIPFVQFVQYHLKVQSYDLYLQRGGAPVPEKPASSYPYDAGQAPPPPPPPPPGHLREAIQPEPPPPPPPGSV
jgi:hypothetical protein